MPEEFGRYELQDLLGRGGMGEVYRALDTVRDRMVALKLLSKHLAADESFKIRFRRESRMVAKLNEPHIIPIHDFGEIDDQLFIDMRLVDGDDLGTVLDAGGALVPELAVGVIAQVASALDAAHRAGLVHRDVKPSNVLLTGLADDRSGDPFAYLVDFGIARSSTAPGTALTAASGTVGTVAYMSPERIGGESGDRSTDIYALACVLYEMLSGHKPFDGELFAIMYAHINTAPPKVSELAPQVPPGLDEVISRGMSKDPDDRYPSAGELARAARAALRAATPHPPSSPPPSPPTSPSRPPAPPWTPPPHSGPPAPPWTPPPHSGPPAPPWTPPPQATSVVSGLTPAPPQWSATPAPPADAPSVVSGPTPPPPPPRAATSAPPASAATSQLPGPTPPPPPQHTTPPPTGYPLDRTPPPPSGPVGQQGPAPAGGRWPPPSHQSGPTPSGAAPRGGTSRRYAVIAGAAAVLVAVVVAVVLAVRHDGSPSAGPSPGPSVPTSTGSGPTTGVSSGGTTGPVVSWADFASFSGLLGTRDGDTVHALKDASCKLIGPASGDPAGLVDQVSCTFPAVPVEMFVDRFASARAVRTYVDTLTTKRSYTEGGWTQSGTTRGLEYVSPASAPGVDITTTMCARPTYLVQLLVRDKSKLDRKSLEDKYWVAALDAVGIVAPCGG